MWLESKGEVEQDKDEDDEEDEDEEEGQCSKRERPAGVMEKGPKERVCCS